MGQSFKIVNRAKQQYLDPFSMRSSDRFPALLGSEEMMRSLGWLMCTSINPRWIKLKNKNDRAKRIIGSWAGDKIEIIGDETENEFYNLVYLEYRDLSYEIVATLFDFDSDYLDDAIQQLEQWPSLLKQLGTFMLLEKPPEQLERKLNAVFPNGWEPEFDRICKLSNYDPRERLKRCVNPW